MHINHRYAPKDNPRLRAALVINRRRRLDRLAILEAFATPSIDSYVDSVLEGSASPDAIVRILNATTGEVLALESADSEGAWASTLELEPGELVVAVAHDVVGNQKPSAVLTVPEP